MVLVSGEPGIGKSRLVQVLKEQVADDVGAYRQYPDPHDIASYV